MAKAKPGTKRRYSGETFSFHTPWRTKKAARRAAADLRKKGWKARVARKPRSLRLLGKWGWVIYARR